MGQLATDTFVRADSTTLGANWTKLSGFSDLRITSNKSKASVASPDCADAYTGAGSVNVDQYSQVIVSAANDGGPCVRCDTTSTFYLLDTQSSDYVVYKCVTGSFTSINSVAVTAASGDTAYLEVQGTTVKSKQNGTVKNNFTDSAINGTSVGGPYPGLHASGTSILYGDGSANGYAMGDFASSTPSVASWRMPFAIPDFSNRIVSV